MGIRFHHFQILGNRKLDVLPPCLLVKELKKIEAGDDAKAGATAALKGNEELSVFLSIGSENIPLRRDDFKVPHAVTGEARMLRIEGKATAKRVSSNGQIATLGAHARLLGVVKGAVKIIVSRSWTGHHGPSVLKHFYLVHAAEIDEHAAVDAGGAGKAREAATLDVERGICCDESLHYGGDFECVFWVHKTSRTEDALLLGEVAIPADFVLCRVWIVDILG